MKTIKNLLLMLVVCLVGLSLVGCGDDSLTKVGILKYVTAPALDSAEEGIVEALAKAGYVDGENIKIVYQNPEANPSTLTNAAISLVNDCDIIFAIATPAAQAVKAEIENQGKNTPLIFTAVTDPEAAGLTNCDFITGTNDMNPVADQVALIKDIKADAKKMGVIYSSNEVNSQVQCDLATAKAASLGMTTSTQTITSVNEITNAVSALVSDGCDAIYLPTDNVIATAVATIVNITNDAGIIVVCGEEGMIGDGGLISYSINYKALGVMTGEMGVQVLNGTKASDIEITGLPIEDLSLVINKKAAAAANITIPQALLDKADTIVE